MTRTSTVKPDTRSAITRSVRHLLDKYGQRPGDVAAVFGTSTKYMAQKLRDSRWTVDDIDTISAYFGVPPAAVVTGEWPELPKPAPPGAR